MDRRSLLRALVAAGLAPQLIRTALAKGNNPVPAGLRKVEGKVTLNGSPAREGQLVKPGDTVKTGAGSSAIYVIGQDAFMQRADSEVHFPIESLEAFLRVVNGKLLSVFGRGQKKLQVSTATIGIRGTACYIEAEATRTYFCLCYGEAEVVPSVAPVQREIIRTEHHDHPIYIHDDPKMATSMVPAAVINHNDAELTMLENLVGRWPAFYGKDYKDKY